MNIDLSEKSIDLFKIARPKDINLNFGVGSKNETLDYFYKYVVLQIILLMLNLQKNF